MQIKETVTLYDNSPGHDKFYTISIVEELAGYSLPFRYGPRVGWRKDGDKVKSPAPYSAAKRHFDKIVNEKLSKGYQIGTSMETPDTLPAFSPVAAPSASTVPPATQVITQLVNDQIEQDKAIELIKDDAYCTQEKHDGERRKLIYNKGMVTGLNKKGRAARIIDPCFVDACQSLAQSSNINHFELDGEEVGSKFYAFDILMLGSTDTKKLPYSTRYQMLADLLCGTGSCLELVVIAYTTQHKAKMMEDLLRGNKEGIVFKRLDSLYENGKNGNQFKYKFYETASCVVVKANAKRSIALSLLDGNTWVDVGNCTIPPNKAIPAVDAIVEIRYLYVANKGGCLYQPTYLDVRGDVDAGECVIEQLKYKAVA